MIEDFQIRHYKTDKAREAAIISLLRLSYNRFMKYMISGDKPFALVFGVNPERMNPSIIDVDNAQEVQYAKTSD
jgi:hypothetical protein